MIVAGTTQTLPKIYSIDWKKGMSSALTIQCGESVKLRWSNDFSGVVQMGRDVCLGPIVKLWAPAGVQGEKTIVTPFTKTGAYYFVDPVTKDCDAGQRLTVTVVGTCPSTTDVGAATTKATTPAATAPKVVATPSPSPAAKPVVVATPSPAAKPVATPSPAAKAAPAPAPAPVPVPVKPSPSPSPKPASPLPIPAKSPPPAKTPPAKAGK